MDMRNTHNRDILLKAFKNALPELREATTEVDMLYHIYEHYDAILKG